MTARRAPRATWADWAAQAAQERFADIYEGAKKKVVAGAKYTAATIRENPYQSLAIALGVGVVLGVLIGRRTK